MVTSRSGSVPAELISPMLAKTGPLPHGPGWAYEMKWDGVRTIAYVDAGRGVALYSRNDRDVSVSYPELAGLADGLGTSVILDGEIVAFDDTGRPSFGRLQNRMHVADRAHATRLSTQFPAVFLAFDLLRLGDTSLLDQTYVDRRELLERLDVNGSSWQTPPAFHGDADQALAASKSQRLEGVVAKRLASIYRPGVRTSDWTKLKNLHTQEVIIGGWREGDGRRAGTIGALLMGIPGADGLDFAGKVGTGFSDAALTDLQHRLERISSDRSPFAQALPSIDARGARWVRPSLVGEVEFSERTADGRLRHPVWRGLRPDKNPDQVVPED